MISAVNNPAKAPLPSPITARQLAQVRGTNTGLVRAVPGAPFRVIVSWVGGQYNAALVTEDATRFAEPTLTAKTLDEVNAALTQLAGRALTNPGPLRQFGGPIATSEHKRRA